MKIRKIGSFLASNHCLLDMDHHHNIFNPQLDLVGDLRELLPQVLELGGLTFNTSLKNGRNATEDKFVIVKI